ALEAVKVQDEAARAKAERLRALSKTQAGTQEQATEAEKDAQATRTCVQRLEAELAALERTPQKQRLAVAQAEVAVAEAELNVARGRLDGTELRAPADGVVVARTSGWP